MKIEFSFDDGHVSDIHIAHMLDKYGFKGVFYIPWTNRGRKGYGALPDNQIASLTARGHEIGFHTYSHPADIKLLSDEEVMEQVIRGKKQLEEIAGHKITKFCYPRGKFNNTTVDAVRYAGFLEARNTKVGQTHQNFDVFRKPTTVHIHPDKKEYQGKHWMAYAGDKFRIARKNGKEGYFHVWGHSWEMSEYRLWHDFNTLLQEIQMGKL